MTEAVIRDLEEQLRSAQLNADVDALDALIADDLLFAGPDGCLVSKADDLAAYRGNVIRISSHQPEELHVRSVRADVFLVSLRARLCGVYAGAAFSVRSRYMRVWARGPEGWRIVGGQVSALSADAA